MLIKWKTYIYNGWILVIGKNDPHKIYCCYSESDHAPLLNGQHWPCQAENYAENALFLFHFSMLTNIDAVVSILCACWFCLDGESEWVYKTEIYPLSVIFTSYSRLIVNYCLLESQAKPKRFCLLKKQGLMAKHT